MRWQSLVTGPALACAIGSLASPLPADPQPAATIRAAGRGAPYLFLRDGQKIVTNYVGGAPPGQSRPLTLASADFDEDGMPDLASGYAAPDGSGIVTIHRGNVNSLWPYGKAVRNGEPPAFLPEARVFILPAAPDFLAAGDFDADGHWDLVAASLGGDALYLLRGDGHGGFAAPERIQLPGTITAFTSGEINRVDGLTDIAVGIASQSGPQVLVFESPNGALRGEPEVFPIAANVTALAMMPLDDDSLNDLAVGAGNQLIAIHGRDRKLSNIKTARDSVPPAAITRQTLPFAVRSLAFGRFTSATLLDLAALGDDGKVHFLERADADYQAARAELPVSIGGRNGSPGPGRRSTRDVQSIPKKPDSREMVLRDEIAMPSALGGATRLITAHTSITPTDDVIATDGQSSQLHVLSRTAGTQAMHIAASFDTPGAPAAVLPMRLTPSALHGLVVLHSGQVEPSVALPATQNIFTVTTTEDPGPNPAFSAGGVDPTNTADPGSLRWAITSAINATGTSLINFNIPVTDPNYNPQTGTFTFTPLPTTSCTIEPCKGLPPLPAGAILDGYTQPGASPSTLIDGDNAVIKIVISGTLAGSGPDGISLLDGGSTARGLNVIEFGSFLTSNGLNTEGGIGIDAESGNNVIEGNFLGIDSTGTMAMPNYIGTGGFGGPLTIGGTTPQARNLLSGNIFANFGGAFPADPNTYYFQGNYVGTDRTGTVAVGGQGGFLTSGRGTVVGGTSAGAGNLLSGNDIGIDISFSVNNPFTPDSNIFQGNLIGTDFTGTVALPNLLVGVDVTSGNYNLVGGTTPAARNVVSGNQGDGIEVYDESSFATVEGNYIGVDISGLKGLPNFGDGIDHAQIGGAANAIGTLIGGESAGAGNIISSNFDWGVQFGGLTDANIASFAATMVGNLIGTDATGNNAMSNGLGGVELIQGASNYIIGGTDTPAANTIAFNSGPGVQIDPAVSNPFTITVGFNSVTGNSIFSNSGPGVWVHSGVDNTVSANSIYSNAGLGIDLDAVGHLVNSSCQSNTSGANNLQNAPVLTAASGGSTLVSATATDPNGNTSEFSNCAAMASSGNTLNIVGSLNSKANTTYNIEFFQNTACDPSTYGQGKTFLNRISVTTGANCIATFGDSANVTTADLSVALGFNHTLYPSINVHFDSAFAYQVVVANNGVASAANVSFTDTLPSSLILNSVSPTQGTCANTGNAITCSLGSLASGATAVVTMNVTIDGSGVIADTANVSSSTTDPNSANNTSTLSLSSTYSYASIDHFAPPSGAVGEGAIPLTIYGVTFYSNATTVTANGTPLTFTLGPSTTCEMDFTSYTCQTMNLTLPASLTASPGTINITVTNPTPGGTSSSMNFVVYASPGTVTHFGLSGIPNPAVQNTQYSLVVTALDANGNVVPGYRGTVTLRDTYQDETFTPTSPYQFTAGDNGSHTFSTKFPYAETEIVAVTDAGTPSVFGSETIVVSPLLGPPSQLIAYTTPDAIPIGYPFPQPVTAQVLDATDNSLPGITVTFTIVPGSNDASGTFSNGQTTIQEVSDSNGLAAAPISANLIAGGFGVNASVGSLTAQFGLGSTSNVPAHLTILVGNPQTGPIDTQFNHSLGVLVTDAQNNPVLEVPVTFSAPTSGPSVNLASTTAVTAATSFYSVVAGGAYLGPIGVANSTPGSYQVTASIGGLSVQFNLTNTTPAATVASMNATGTPQSAIVHSQFGANLAVQAFDANSNCISQVPITFTVPASGPSATLSATMATTDPVTCLAQVTATANGIAGSYNVTATTPNGVSTTFALTNTTGSTSLQATGGTPQTASVGAAFTAALQATLLDGKGNPLTGQPVYFSVPAAGASASISSTGAVTNSSGVAQVTATANGVAGGYSVTATFGTLSATFSLTNAPATVGHIDATGGTPQSALIGTPFVTPLQLVVRDTNGEPMSGVSVNFNAPASGAGANLSSSSALTNSSGIASVTATANQTVGNYYVTGSVGAVSANFSLTNTPGPPAGLTATGTPQATLIGTKFAIPLQVTVEDAGGNPVAGMTVNFATPSSAATATLSSSSAVSNTAGIASVTATANNTAGSYSVTATLGSFTATFVLTNSAFSPCDVNQDGKTNVSDVQKTINEALGATAAANDLNADHVVNAVDIQIVVNAVLGLGCS